MADAGENVIRAIDIMVSDAVDRAGYNRTIQAQVESCIDASTGKYRCRYQDAVFDAYSTNAEVSYPDKSMVYVLIPNNDLNKDNKIILGTTKKLGINYINMKQGSEDSYDMIGTNVVSDDESNNNNNGIYRLDTKIKNYKYRIYDANWEDNNLLKIDTRNL